MDFFPEIIPRDPTLLIQFRYPASDSFRDRLPSDLAALLALKRSYNCQILDSIECDLDRAAELKHLATHVRYRICVLTNERSAKDAEFMQEYERQLPLMKWRPTPDVEEVLTTDPQVKEDGDALDNVEEPIESQDEEIATSIDFVTAKKEDCFEEIVSPVVSPAKVATANKRSNDRGLRVKRNIKKNTDFMFLNENLVELETISAVSNTTSVHRGRIKPNDTACRLIFDNDSGCGKSLIRTIRTDSWKRLPRMSRYEAELYHLFTGQVVIVGKNYTMVRVSSAGFNENVSEWMHDDIPRRHALLASE